MQSSKPWHVPIPFSRIPGGWARRFSACLNDWAGKLGPVFKVNLSIVNGDTPERELVIQREGRDPIRHQLPREVCLYNTESTFRWYVRSLLIQMSFWIPSQEASRPMGEKKRLRREASSARYRILSPTSSRCPICDEPYVNGRCNHARWCTRRFD